MECRSLEWHQGQNSEWSKINAPVSSCAASSSSAPAAPLLQIHNNQLYKTTTDLIQQPTLKTTTTGLHVETSTCYNQNIFTGHNEVGPRQCFYRCVWFCLQGGGVGGLPRCTPPPAGTPPPPGQAGTPQQVPPLRQAGTHPLPGTPSQQVPPQDR